MKLVLVGGTAGLFVLLILTLIVKIQCMQLQVDDINFKCILIFKVCL